MSDLKTKTISSLFWKLMERGGNAVVSLIVQVVLARLLLPEDFGMLAIIIVFVNIGAVFVQSGLNSALVQSPTISEEDYSTVFWFCFFIALLLYVGIFFIAPFVADFYNSEGLVWPLRAIAILLIINALNAVQIAKVTRDLELKKTFYATIASVVVSGLCGIAVALCGYGVWALVVQQLIYQLVNCAVLGLQIRWRPSFVFSFKRARDLFKFGWKILVSGLLNTLYQSFSSLIIGKQFSQYSLDDVKGLTRRALKTSAFLVIPIMLTFSVVAEPFTRVFLGDQWLAAVPFFQLYCLIYALYPLQTSNLQAINGIGRSDIYLKLEIVKKVYGVIIVLFCALVLQNIYAVVCGLLLSNVISVFVNSLPTKRLIGYSLLEQIKDIFPSILLSVVACAASSLAHLASLSPIIMLIVQVIVAVVLYVLLAAIFKVEEFTYLFTTLKERFLA